MFVVLGATGHVGSAVVRALRDAGEQVTAVVRDPAKAADLRAIGAEIAVADVSDVERLRDVFRVGRRAFLLNPPAAPDTDTDAEERRTGDAIVAALDGSGLEKVVAQSAYCAQAGDAIGDLGTLHRFEERLAAQSIPATVLRAAYYMSNWDAMLEAARAGTLPTMFPADTALPMAAPTDLGRAAARLLRAPAGDGLHHVEGPERYTSADVAEAFAAALGHRVALEVTPRDCWEDAYRALGFSASAARSYAGMTAISVDGDCALSDDPERGSTTLRRYIAGLVARAGDAPRPQ